MRAEALQVRNWVLKKRTDIRRNMRLSGQWLALTLDAKTVIGS